MQSHKRHSILTGLCVSTSCSCCSVHAHRGSFIRLDYRSAEHCISAYIWVLFKLRPHFALFFFIFSHTLGYLCYTLVEFSLFSWYEIITFWRFILIFYYQIVIISVFVCGRVLSEGREWHSAGIQRHVFLCFADPHPSLAWNSPFNKSFVLKMDLLKCLFFHLDLLLHDGALKHWTGVDEVHRTGLWMCSRWWGR